MATKLSGLLRARQIIQHVVSVRYSNVAAINSNRSTVNLKHHLPCIGITSNQQFHQAAASREAIKPTLDPRPRKLKILKKLSSNKVSLQFDEFSEIRMNLFRNYKISAEDGFEILKSCSQLVDRGSDERIKLVNECWTELASLIGKPTKNQLILLLQAYRRAGLKSFENYKSFFERYRCAIDVDIFAELMYIACQNDDSMETAEHLLKDLVGQNIEPTEKVYNALILGYSKQGVEAVENVLETMRSKKIAPSLDTNAELIKAYLVNKNEGKALEILGQSNEYSSDQLYDIIRCASIEGNEKVAEKALSLLPDVVRNAKLIVPQLQNICTELVHLNRHRLTETKLDPYRLIMRHLPTPIEDTDSEYGMFLLKEMIVANESVANILDFCHKLIDDNRNSYSIHNCCMYSLVFHLPIAYDFLEALAAKESLRPHYFWPLLAHATNQSDVIEVVKFAHKLSVIIDSETLENYVLPRTNALIDAQSAIAALTSNGVRMLELKSAMIAFLVNQNHPMQALDIAQRSTAAIDADVVVPAICRFIRGPKFSKNASTIANLIKKLQARTMDKQYDVAGQIVLEFCSSRDRIDSFGLAKRLIGEYDRAGVRISLNAADSILDKIHKVRSTHETMKPIVQGLIDKETIVQDPLDPALDRQQKNDIESLEQQLAEFKANNLPTHGILYRLLVKHVQYSQYERAFEVKKQCDETGVLETPAILATLLKLWTATENVDKALDAYYKLKEQHPTFNMDAFKVFDLATLLINKSRLDDAKHLIKEIPHYKGKSKYMANLSSNIWHLLNAASQYSVENGYDENTADQFLRLLIAKGYAEHSNALLGAVIKEYLDKKKIHEAVNTFEQYATKYRRTPQSLSLLTLLIEISNDENCLGYPMKKQEAVECIQQIIDLIKQVHGSDNANVSVILAFASAGNEQQLRKILMNPLVKFNVGLLFKSLDYLKDRAKIEVVVALAHSARGLNHEDLEEEKLYEILLSDFVRKNDYGAAVRLYEQIQSDDSSVISRKFHKTLVDLLVKNNQPIPDTLNVKVY